MANRFIELVEAGRIADEAALKRAFRAAAKRAHPDILGGSDPGVDAGSREAIQVAESAARAFIALRADYEAALAYLGSRGTAASAENFGPARSANPDIRPFSRGAFYESFEDLLARGFPRRPRTAYPRAGYDESRARLLSYLAGRDQVFPEDRALAAFLSFEAGYAALARPGSGWLSVENDPARSLYFVLSDIVLYHETGFAHTAAFARNVRPTTEALLQARGETRPLDFLAILVDDLDGGPACAK